MFHKYHKDKKKTLAKLKLSFSYNLIKLVEIFNVQFRLTVKLGLKKLSLDGWVDGWVIGNKAKHEANVNNQGFFPLPLIYKYNLSTIGL